MSKPVFRLLSAVALVGMSVQATPTYTAAYDAQEGRVRDGIGHVLEKLRSGQPVKVAYLGGSITEIDGWRRLSREWLQGRYPASAISEIAAAIGGTGSSLGVFRLGDDVLSREPDLLFVEFATNDIGEDPATIWRNFEGIVRQTWRYNPNTDIVFVYTITSSMVNEYASGRCPRAAGCMEMLADHYGIPSICFGPRVAADVNAGKLVMSIGEAETAVPQETPNRDQEIAKNLALKGQKLFSKDGVHPVLDGAAYYLASITNVWPMFEGRLGAAEHAAKLDTVYFDASYENAKLVAIDGRMLRGMWRQIPKGEENASFAGRFGGLPWFTSTPGAKLKFSFKGTVCMLYDLLGPDCGQYWKTVDGVRSSVPEPLFDSYCAYYRLAAQPICEGENGVHTIELELDDKQPDRTSVSEYQANPTKYNGTTWYAGKLMLVGDLEIPEKEGNWFDAHVGQYEEWPGDAVCAEGGEWRAESMARASLWRTGNLDIEATDGLLDFSATVPKILSKDARSTTIEADMDFGEYEVGQLPAVDATWKGGVTVARDNGIVYYYGIAKDGNTNVWVRLDGPNAAERLQITRVTITVAANASAANVRYVVDGVACSHNGLTSMPIVIAGEQKSVSHVSFGGQGVTSRLVGSANDIKRGLCISVR